MKASGVTKCSGKKGSNTGESSMGSLSSPRSPLQVDGEVHFHVDSNGISNYSAVPDEKSIEISQRTYSRKNPTAFPVPSEEIPTFAIHLPVKAKSLAPAPTRMSSSPGKVNSIPNNAQPRKRKTRLELLSQTPSKVAKVNLQSKDAPQSCPPKLSRSRSLPTSNCDSDSDVEIVAVKVFQPLTLQVRKSPSLRKLNTAPSSQGGRKKSKYFEPQVNHNEILMNEADIAPAMSADSFPDGQPGDSNSMRWLSANGTGGENGLKTGPEKHAAPAKCTNQHLPESSLNVSKTNQPDSLSKNQSDKMAPSTSKATFQHMTAANMSPSKKRQDRESFSKILSELPSSANQQGSRPQQSLDKPKKSRELENLTIDLNAKHIPSTSRSKLAESILSIEKSSKKIDPPSKNTSKKQTPSMSKSTSNPVPKPNTSQEKVPKKSRELASLYKNLNEISWTHESSFRKLLRNPDYIRHSERSPKTDRPVKNPRKTNGKIAAKLSKIRKNHRQFKNNMKQTQKAKASKVGKEKQIAIKEEVIDEETDVFYMLKPQPSKDNNNKKNEPDQEKVSKGKSVKSHWKHDSTLKVKTESSNGKFTSLKSLYSPEELKAKQDIKKSYSIVPLKKHRDPLASTSGLQRNGHCKSLPLTKAFKARPMDFAPNMGVILNCPEEEEEEELYLAYQNASKLQVRVQPLEHTNFWTNDFYEDFRKRFLDQALRRALESREMDSSYAMFQDMLGSLVGNQGNGRRRRRPEEEALRCSARQSEGAFRYKEIVVKRQPNYMQLVLVPNTAKQNCLTVEAMKEMKEALLLAKKDPNCRAVLINSSGPYFCTGIDLAPLVGNNKKQAADEISISLRDLVMTLGMFPKPVVAAVNGAALGFGVSLLTYCDVVLASDKATFCLPAAKIGYIPEGGVTYTLPQVVGSSVASEMLMQGRRITAEQACKYGLVSEVIWPTRLMNEVIPRLQNIISQPLQGLEATKTMVRCRLWDKLKVHVERERELLQEHWASTVCQNNIKTLLQTGWLLE